MALPTELEGKTAEEVAEYYQQRESVIREKLARPDPSPDDEKIDIFGDPTGSINRAVDRRVTAEMGRMSSQATPALIQAARIVTKDRYRDFEQFGTEIEKRMKTMTPEAQINPEFWALTYKVVKGEQADSLIEAALTKERTPVERPTPAGEQPVRPKELSADEKDVARKMGMSEDKFRSAIERYEKSEGRLPLTIESTNKNKKKAS